MQGGCLDIPVGMLIVGLDLGRLSQSRICADVVSYEQADVIVPIDEMMAGCGKDDLS